MHDLSAMPMAQPHLRAPGLPNHNATPRADAITEASTCPHVDRDDARCGHRLTLGRIEQAFSVCFGAFNACPLYHRLCGEIDAATDFDAPARPLIEIRIIRHAERRALRATGS